MTEEEQETISQNSEDTKPPIQSEPEHEFEFKAGEQIFDRYQVIKPLGVGGFAEVYHCRDTQLPRDVAVKVLKGKEAGLEDAHAAADFHHSNIVTVYALHHLDNDRPIIAFRYIEGQTLEDRLEAAPQGRLPLDRDTLDIITQIAGALDYAHKRGVIHRDVKPSNIILGTDGNAYLTDFGLAAVKPTIEAAKSMLSVDDAPSGLSGTIPYMAPEQLAEGKPGDKPSDLYSLGVMVYRMLTGRFPYEEQGKQGTVLIAQIIANVLVPPTKINEGIPMGIERVLLQALNKTPEKRYTSCSEFARALDKAAQTYLAFSDQYEDARNLFEDRQWRQALTALESLKENAPPGFKGIGTYLEQARTQMELLAHFERAQEQVKQGAYQDALKTLGIIIDKDPNYDIDDLYNQASEEQARVEEQELESLYQQAVQQFQNEKFEACLNTLDAIHKRDSEYPDSEEIEPQARKQAKIQSELRALFDLGTEQMNNEEWGHAGAIFRELQQKAPDYQTKDVERQLAVATSMAPLLALLKEARVLLEQKEYTTCVDRLDELRKQNATFKPNEVAGLRQDALSELHTQTKRSLQKEPFDRSESLEKLEALRKFDPNHPGLEELDNQFQVRTLRAELDDLYQKVLEKLEQWDYEGALKDWEIIQKQKGDLDYSDSKDVERGAKRGLCSNLYNQALRALLQEDQPRKALELWEKIHEINPKYPDRDGIEKQAREMVSKCADLYRQAQEALSQGKSQRALELWHEVCEANPDFRDSQDVEKQAQVMNLYNRAVEALDQGDSQRALKLWHEVREVYPDYPDSQDVEKKAQRHNQVTKLYNQALEALDQRESHQALELWNRVREVNPGYVDGQDIEGKARAIIAQQERAQKLRRMATLVGGAIIILVCIVALIVLGGSLLRGCLPTPHVTETITPTPTRTEPTPPQTTTPSPTHTTMPDTSTKTHTPTPKTSTPKLTPSPTPTPTPSDDTATAILDSSIFAAPNVNSTELSFVREGDQVPVLGRSAVGEWFYIRNTQSIEGFAHAPRFQWSGNFDSLPVKSTVEAPSPTPSTSTSPTSGGTTTGNLEMDLWPLDGQCIPGGWYRMVFIGGRGGNGTYTYYWNGEIVGGPMSDGIGFQVRGGSSSIIGKGKVVSGDGQSVERDLYVPALDCGN